MDIIDLEAKNLNKIYNDHLVLDIPEIKIKKSEIVGLIGNNGAGKTTFLRLLIDLIKADNGIVSSRGKNVSRTENWKNYTSAYIDKNFLIEFLTPEEYFSFIMSNYNITKEDGLQILHKLDRFMNGEILGKKKYIRNFSTGNQQKIGIIGAVLCKPEILILDEPFNYLDPSSQNFINDYLCEMNNLYNTTIILSSHNLEHVFGISSRILLLERGNIIEDIFPVHSENKKRLNRYFMPI